MSLAVQINFDGNCKEALNFYAATFGGGEVFWGASPMAAQAPAGAQRVFAALAEGGSVVLPLQETFWSKAYGIVTDRFGVPWELNCESEVG